MTTINYFHTEDILHIIIVGDLKSHGIELSLTNVVDWLTRSR